MSARPDLRLIVITDDRLAAPRPVEDVVALALEAGAPAIQLRAKDAAPAEIFRRAVRLREMTRRAGALLFINDRLDIALAVEADGVHLGPDDLPVAAARAAVARARSGGEAAPGPGGPYRTRAGRPFRFLIGFSTDDPAAARAAEIDGADYIGCGAVFGTTSKAEVGDERIGVDRLAEVVRSVSVPVVGIGGVTPENARAVAATGAAGAAVIGAVMAADDPRVSCRTLLEAFISRSAPPTPTTHGPPDPTP